MLAVREAIKRSRTGDIDALEPIYQHYRELVFRICYRMAKDQAQAADWTQEIFIRAFQRIGSYKEKADFSTWLYRVAMNYCLDQLKKSSRKTVPLESIHERPGPGNPAESLLRKERRSVIWHALESLDPNLRAVLVLKDMEELSYAEISRKLDIPEGTVGSRLNQARKELAENLKGHSAIS